MSQQAHQHLDDLAKTDAYQARFRYRDAPRTSDSAEDVSFGQLGHMLDTLKDAVLYMRHVSAEPALDVTEDHVYKHIGLKGVPPYVAAIGSDWRVASTFNRTDTGRAIENKRAPDLAAFMNQVHGMMRQQSLHIGRSFMTPPALADDIAQYDALAKRWEALLDANLNPSGLRDYRLIPEADRAAFVADFEPAADRLYEKLKALPQIEVQAGGQTHVLPNAAPLNDRLSQTYPALVLFAFRTLGKGAADNNKRPATWEYDKRQRELIGAQSMITDTTQALLGLAESHGVDFGADFDRVKLQKAIGQHVRSFQLALAFCRTAGCDYPAMTDDLERFIRMGGGEPALRDLASPQEAAMLLYAGERALARIGSEPGLGMKLREYADRLGGMADLPEAQAALQGDIAFQRDLMRGRELAENAGRPEAAQAFEMLRASLAPLRGAGARRDPPAQMTR